MHGLGTHEQTFSIYEEYGSQGKTILKFPIVSTIKHYVKEQKLYMN